MYSGLIKQSAALSSVFLLMTAISCGGSLNKDTSKAGPERVSLPQANHPVDSLRLDSIVLSLPENVRDSARALLADVNCIYTSADLGIDGISVSLGSAGTGEHVGVSRELELCELKTAIVLVPTVHTGGTASTGYVHIFGLHCDQDLGPTAEISGYSIARDGILRLDGCGTDVYLSWQNGHCGNIPEPQRVRFDRIAQIGVPFAAIIIFNGTSGRFQAWAGGNGLYPSGQFSFDPYAIWGSGPCSPARNNRGNYVVKALFASAWHMAAGNTVTGISLSIR